MAKRRESNPTHRKFFRQCHDNGKMAAAVVEETPSVAVAWKHRPSSQISSSRRPLSRWQQWMRVKGVRRMRVQGECCGKTEVGEMKSEMFKCFVEALTKGITDGIIHR